MGVIRGVYNGLSLAALLLVLAGLGAYVCWMYPKLLEITEALKQTVSVVGGAF